MIAAPFNIFIVDDEPAARMTVAFPFDDPRYRITEFDSGKALLDAIGQNPDVVLLDVEMPGLNGIDTCRALRESAGWNGHVIFVSAHDDMETRLRAYDAGGTDYIAKPINAAELLQKVKVAERLLQEKRSVEDQAAMASRTAFTAMSSMGELGMVIQFLRTSFGCTTCPQLAQALLAALQPHGLGVLVEMRISGQDYTVSSGGACSPLEQSILRHGRGMGQQFQFRDRLVINYPAITLVISRLPIDDPDTVGRLRDHLAILAEGASARIVALATDAAYQTQVQGIHDALAVLTEILANAEHEQANYRLSALATIDEYTRELEHSFVRLELSSPQEEALAHMARKMAEKLGGQLGDSREIGDKLQAVVGRLRQLTG